MNRPASVYSVPGETALFSTPARALWEYVNYVSLDSFSLAVQPMSLMLLICLLKCLRSRIVCPSPEVINMLPDTGDVL